MTPDKCPMCGEGLTWRCHDTSNGATAMATCQDVERENYGHPNKGCTWTGFVVRTDDGMVPFQEGDGSIGSAILALEKQVGTLKRRLGVSPW